MHAHRIITVIKNWPILSVADSVAIVGDIMIDFLYQPVHAVLPVRSFLTHNMETLGVKEIFHHGQALYSYSVLASTVSS